MRRIDWLTWYAGALLAGGICRVAGVQALTSWGDTVVVVYAAVTSAYAWTMALRWWERREG
jgi:hypothetical protein